MDDTQLENLSHALSAAGKAMRYPITPDLAAAFMGTYQRKPNRRLSLALAAALVVLASLLAVPEVRARIAEFLQIGAVRITIPQESPTQPDPEEGSVGDITVVSVESLTGETSLAQAREEVNFEIPLPSYPADLEQPDRVFVQDFDRSEFVILIWESDIAEIELALYILGPGVDLTKSEPQTVEVVIINGRPGAWVTGNHFLFFDGECCEGVLVQAPALVWQVGQITYRLESELTLEEVIQIAESIN